MQVDSDKQQQAPQQGHVRPAVQQQEQQEQQASGSANGPDGAALWAVEPKPPLVQQLLAAEQALQQMKGACWVRG